MVVSADGGGGGDGRIDETVSRDLLFLLEIALDPRRVSRGIETVCVGVLGWAHWVGGACVRQVCVCVRVCGGVSGFVGGVRVCCGVAVWSTNTAYPM